MGGHAIFDHQVAGGLFEHADLTFGRAQPRPALHDLLRQQPLDFQAVFFGRAQHAGNDGAMGGSNFD